MFRVFQVAVTLLALSFVGMIIYLEVWGDGLSKAIDRGDLRRVAFVIAMMSGCTWFAAAPWINHKIATRAAVLFVAFIAVGISGQMAMLAFGSHDGFLGPCASGKSGNACRINQSLHEWGGDLAVACQWLPFAAFFYALAFKVYQGWRAANAAQPDADTNRAA